MRCAFQEILKRKGEDEEPCLKDNNAGAGEIAQWLRAPAALPEDPGLIPSTHVVAHNCL